MPFILCLRESTDVEFPEVEDRFETIAMTRATLPDLSNGRDR